MLKNLAYSAAIIGLFVTTNYISHINGFMKGAKIANDIVENYKSEQKEKES